MFFISLIVVLVGFGRELFHSSAKFDLSEALTFDKACHVNASIAKLSIFPKDDTTKIIVFTITY